MSICVTCNKEMNSGESCSHKFLVRKDGSRVPRVTFLSKNEAFFDGESNPENCPDCGVTKGGVHHEDCDIERCPDCKRQLISWGREFIGTSESENSEIRKWR